MIKKLLRSCSDRIEAELVQGYLDSQGLQSYIEADDCGGWAPHLNVLIPVKLFVAEGDLERARELLEEFDKEDE